jgi:hypothetical protein
VILVSYDEDVEGEDMKETEVGNNLAWLGRRAADVDSTCIDTNFIANFLRSPSYLLTRVHVKMQATIE